LVHTVDGLLAVVDLLLSGIDHTTDQDDLVGRVVFDGESESAVGFDNLLAISLLTEHAVDLVNGVHLVQSGDSSEDSVVVLLLFIVVYAAEVGGGGDTIFSDLDGGLVNELVQVHFANVQSGQLIGQDVSVRRVQVVLGVPAETVQLAQVVFEFGLLVVADTGDSGEVGVLRVERVLDTLLFQTATDVDFLLNLEFGQLHTDGADVAVGLLQELLQLVAVLQVSLFHLGQTVLVLGHDGVQGQLLLLGRDTNNFHQLVFVILEAALSFHNLNDFHLLLVQREEFRLPGNVLTHLRAPGCFHFHTVDQDHFGVGGDCVAWNDVVEFHVRSLRHPVVDHVAALLRLLLEVAFLDLSARVTSHLLDKVLLGRGVGGDDDGGDWVDFRVRVQSVVQLPVVLGQGLEDLMAFLLLQTAGDGAGDLAFRVSAGSLVQSGQRHLDGQRRGDGVLVVFLFFRLPVKAGSEFRVGVLHFTEWTGLSLVEVLFPVVAGAARAVVVVVNGVVDGVVNWVVEGVV